MSSLSTACSKSEELGNRSRTGRKSTRSIDWGRSDSGSEDHVAVRSSKDSCNSSEGSSDTGRSSSSKKCRAHDDTANLTGINKLVVNISRRCARDSDRLRGTESSESSNSSECGKDTDESQSSSSSRDLTWRGCGSGRQAREAVREQTQHYEINREM